MRFKSLELQNDISVNVYDKTKTSVFGRVVQKMVDGENVIGPPLTKFIDLQTEGATIGAGPMHCTQNGRIFYITAVATGTASIHLVDWDFTLGQYVYQGRIVVTLPNAPATTHTVRYIRVYDGPNPATVTDWDIVIGSVASGTNAIPNGGVFLVHKVNKSQFSKVTVNQFFMAVSGNANAVYHLNDPAALGVSNNQISLMGGGLNGQEVLTTTGTAASFQGFGYDLTVAPTVNPFTVTNPSTATFTAAGHDFQNGDRVVLLTTGTTFGGFTASTATTHNVYFVVNTVLGSTFQLSATFGGAAITATTAGTGVQTALRAFGSTTALHKASRKTGTITSGFLGTALLLDNQQVATPFDGSLAGVPSYFFATSTNFYFFALSDWAAGVTSLPTSTVINNLGTGVDITAPTTTLAKYAQSSGLTVYSASTFSFMTKRWVNSQLFSKFGGPDNQWLENSGRLTDSFRALTFTGLETESGWLFVMLSTVGQRGILALPLLDDAAVGSSYFTSKVIEIGNGKLKFVATLEQLFDFTDTLNLQIRSAPLATDPVFNSASGGWVDIAIAEDLESVAIDKFVQVRGAFDVMTPLVATPAQVKDIEIGRELDAENSDHFELDHENTTKEGVSPPKSAAYLRKVYDSAVPFIQFSAISKSTEAIVLQRDTQNHAAEFSYSTDDGTTWLPLGTIPNVAGTRVRYNWSTPIPEDVTVAFKEL